MLNLGSHANNILAAATFWFAKDAMNQALGVNIGGWEPSRGEATMVGVVILISIAVLAMWAANREPAKDTDEDQESCLNNCFGAFNYG